MSNKVEPIDTLAEALRKSCGLFNQLVSEHTRLRKLGSNDRPTEPCIRRVNGKGQILTAEEAITHDETKVIEQSLVLHGVEHDFLAAIKDTRESLNRSTSLVIAIEPFEDKPRGWLAGLLGEINELELAALLPYPCNDDPASQPGALAPEDRMAALRKVQRRLNRLDDILQIGLQTPPKRNVDGIADPIANCTLADLCGMSPNTVSVQMRKALAAAGKAIKTVAAGGSRYWSHDELRAACPHLPKGKPLQEYLVSMGFGKQIET